jgi:MscS family membrane protein
MPDFLNTLYYSNTLGQWAIALFLILLSVVLGRVIYWVFGRWVKFLTRKTETKLDDIIIDMVEEPVVLIIILLGIRFSFNTLVLPDTFMAVVNGAFQFVLALTLAWLISRLYDALHQEYIIPFAARTKTELDDQLLPIIKTGIRIVVWTLGIVIGLNNAGYDIGAVLAGLGIGGLAFALAAQDTVSNIFGGITIFLQKPFRVGNRIEVAGFDGWVQEIGLRSSVIANFYGHRITIPNKMFIDSPVKNIDSQPAYWIKQVLHLRHDMTAEKIELAINLLKDAVAANQDLLNETTWIGFDNIGDYSFDIIFWYGIKLWQPEDQKTIGDWYHKMSLGKTRLNLEILRQFATHDIKLAVPVELRIAASDLGDSIFVNTADANLPMAHHQK